MNKKAKNNGITLIALVITIIVMLILVGVTISMSLNGGLFVHAKQAKEETEKAKQEEINLSGGTINGQTINEIVNGNAYTAYEKAEKNADGTLKENITYTENGKTAEIPKGFAVSKVTGEQTIEEGLVITDKVDEEGNSIGNEFVWVPVEDGKLDRTEWENNNPTETISEDYTETLPEDIVASVAKYKGFYIGRYEAGSTTARTSSSGTTTMVVQKGAYPYNYVDWNSAVPLSEGMYNDSDAYGVKSILPYGAMWDETLRFVKDENHNVTNSTDWGNYDGTTFTFSGRYYTSGTWSEEVTNETTQPYGWLLTTGASETNKAKNIYDLAGNVCEWTMETYSASLRVCRGGYSGSLGSFDPASYRSDYNTDNSFWRHRF